VSVPSIASAVFIALYSVTALGVALVVIAENRNPLKSIAWILVLILTPGVGLLAYFLFGQDNRKQRIISRRTYRRITREMAFPQSNLEMKALHTLPPSLPRSSEATGADLIKLLQKTADTPPLQASDIRIFSSGHDKFDVFLADISQAKHHIHLEYYIFDDDYIGQLVREALIRKAKEGVAVRVLYDGVGSWSADRRFFREMQAAGIRVYAFLHVTVPLFYSKVNYRNHRKIAVIDGRIGYVGGMNIADRYRTGLAWGIWRDTHLRFTGEAVRALQFAFAVDWYVASKEQLSDLSGETPYRATAEAGNAVQIATGGPTGHWRILLQATIRLITSSRHYVYIQTPYFLPTESLNQALQIASLSGVDVRLMLPQRSDTLSAHLAGRSYLDDLVRAGVKIYFYEKGFLHAKVIVSDDKVSCVGSANMDFRSFEHNFEINAYIYGEEFALRMRQLFEDDMQSCRHPSAQEWFRRPRKYRIVESFFRLFSPLM
jgi:cardiolipin synthase